jgi:NTE family protein
MHRERKGTGIGLACAGGVVEGAFYEVGALCALADSIENLDLTGLDAYVGISAGSMIVAGLANGITPHQMSRAIVFQTDPELSLRPEFLFTSAGGDIAGRLVRLPLLLTASLRKYMARRADLGLLGALVELEPALPTGFFDNAPLERFLAKALSTGGRTNDFRQLAARLYIVAVELDTSKLVLFGDDATAHIPISKAVQASTALPLLYRPVEIEGRYYIDGVARRTLSASAALGEGVGLLFCVNPIVPIDLSLVPSGNGAKAPRSLVEHGLINILSQTFRTLIHSRMRSAFRSYQHEYPQADIILIEPEMGDPTLFFSNIFSFSNRLQVCEHGYQTTRRYLLREFERLQPMLERHGLKLLHDVLTDERQSLLGAASPRPKPNPDGVEPQERTKGPVNQQEPVLARLDGALTSSPHPDLP